MATSEPWAIGGGLPGIESQSATAAALNGDLETLIDFKDTLTTIPIKGVIESAIVFLTLVRVSLFSPFQFSQPLIGNTIRTRW